MEDKYRPFKIALIPALLLCLAPMPYGYYTLVRISATIIFVMMAMEYSKQKKQNLMVTFSILVLLFQPIVKIALSKTLWNVIDIAVAIMMVFILVREKEKTE